MSTPTSPLDADKLIPILLSELNIGTISQDKANAIINAITSAHPHLLDTKKDDHNWTPYTEGGIHIKDGERVIFTRRCGAGFERWISDVSNVEWATDYDGFTRKIVDINPTAWMLVPSDRQFVDKQKLVKSKPR